MMNSIKIGNTYRMSGIDVICVDFTRRGHAKMQTLGMTVGTWPGQGDISNYDEITKEFTSEWKGVIKKFRLPTKKQLEKNELVTKALTAAAYDRNSFESSYSCAWIDMVDGCYLRYVYSNLGYIYATNNPRRSYVVAPMFNLDVSKVLIDGNKITRKINEDSKEVEIKDVKPGTSILVGDTVLDVLDNHYMSSNSDEGVLCLAKDILFNAAFDEYNCNDWTSSTLRRDLHREFKNNLIAEIGKNALLPFERDLLSDDGMKDYGKCIDSISIISCDEYKTYREYISHKSSWWWTLTPWTCRKGDSTPVRLVDSAGSLRTNYAFYSDRGVSPLVLLHPSLRVKVVETQRKNSSR